MKHIENDILGVLFIKFGTINTWLFTGNSTGPSSAPVAHTTYCRWMCE